MSVLVVFVVCVCVCTHMLAFFFFLSLEVFNFSSVSQQDEVLWKERFRRLLRESDLRERARQPRGRWSGSVTPQPLLSPLVS